MTNGFLRRGCHSRGIVPMQLKRKLKCKWTRDVELEASADGLVVYRGDAYWDIRELVEVADYYLIIGDKANEWI